MDLRLDLAGGVELGYQQPELSFSLDWVGFRGALDLSLEIRQRLRLGLVGEYWYATFTEGGGSHRLGAALELKFF